jgi:hypothetical protein
MTVFRIRSGQGALANALLKDAGPCGSLLGRQPAYSSTNTYHQQHTFYLCGWIPSSLSEAARQGFLKVNSHCEAFFPEGHRDDVPKQSLHMARRLLRPAKSADLAMTRNKKLRP